MLVSTEKMKREKTRLLDDLEALLGLVSQVKVPRLDVFHSGELIRA